MIGFKSAGSFSHTMSYLGRISNGGLFTDLDRYGQMGVDALSNATPRDSGETAQSWAYRVVRKRGFVSIEWYNTHVNNGSQIAILIQYGHGTGTGGYVPGRDYINPAVKPVFDSILAEIERKVRQ